MEDILSTYEITVLLRIVAAILCGFAIGLERELTNKYAGLRTNILVCLGACVFTLISIYGFPMGTAGAEDYGMRDTARVAAQIVTGIGFIGGGTVLRHGATVIGLTTAATLWISASIGMACGAGLFGIAAISTLLSILVLISVRLFERKVLVSSAKNFNKLKLTLSCPTQNADAVYDYIVEHYPKLYELSKTPAKNIPDHTQISAVLKIRHSKKTIENMYKKFHKVEGIESISIEEFKS